jgi:curli biogenesis system outer membrane secretion channel CsgG
VEPPTTLIKKAAVIAAVIVACALVSLHAQTSGGAAPRKVRVAVLDFDYATVASDVSIIFGRNVDVGKGVTDLLVNYLVKDGNYSVIERKTLDTIIAEQNFSNSDRADASSAARIGKLLGVDAIIAGSITQFGNDTRSTGIGAVGGGLGRLGLGRVNQKESKAIVGLTARIVSIDTAEILAVADGKGESKRTSTSLAGAGAGWSGFGGGSVDFGSSNFQSTIIGEAVKAAVETMSTSVVAGRTRIATRAVSVQGLVAAVVGKQLILNVGGKAGVRVGDTLTVQRVSQEIKDPATGKVIRRLSTDVGTVRVAEVDDESSVVDIVSGSDFKVSDTVKSGNQ